VVFHQLNGNIAVRKQFDVIEKFPRGDGACAWLFYFSGTGGANALVQVSRGDGQAVGRIPFSLPGLEQKI
jgi:hypothetical protein